MLRNKKRDSDALPLAAAYARQPEGDGCKKYPPQRDFYYSNSIWRLFFIAVVNDTHTLQQKIVVENNLLPAKGHNNA